MLLYRQLRFILPVLMISGLFGVWPYQALAEEVLVAHPALTFGDIPYYIIARGNGFYYEEDLQVKGIYIRGGVTAFQALQAGSVHFTLALGSGVRRLYPE